MPTPTTANRNYQLPHPENELDTDVQRLISALQAIDADVASLLVSVSQAALASHGHTIGDVTGLQAALNDKAAAGHTHAINDLTDVDITGAPAGRPLTTQVGGGVGIGPAPMTQDQVDAAISAAIAALADAAPATLDTLNELAAALGDDPNFAATMTAALAGKAAVGHTHSTAEVSGLDAELTNVASDVASNTGRIDALESAPPPPITGVYESAPTSVAESTLYTFAHGLGKKPVIIKFFAYCYATGSYAYGASVGDEARCVNPEGSGVRWYADDTNIYVPFGATGGQESFTFKMHTGSGVTVGLPSSAMAPHWKFRVRAYG